MRSAVAVVIAFGIFPFGIFHSAGVYAESTIDKADVERLPISGMNKVTQSDGSVMYLSDDRRFVFVGKMFDLWNGEALDAGVEVSQKVDWDRNGVSLARIAFPVGEVLGDRTIFVAPDCDDCRELLKVAMERFSDRLNVVLLSATDDGLAKNRQVWCAKEKATALQKVYIDRQKLTNDDVNENCDQFGLMLAEQAAMLFGIGQLPMFVDENNMGFTGNGAIVAVTK